MRDQADKLRQLMDDFRGAPQSVPRPRIVLLASGRSGDGTTTAALHLAMELRRQGSRVVLLEADPQGGHLALLCRLTEGPTLADVLSGRRQMPDVIHPGPGDILVVPGAWGLEAPLPMPPSPASREPKSISPADWLNQFQQLSPAPEVLVIDAGSGSSRMLQDLWHEADTAIVVTGAGAASLMNAYALIKYLAGHGRTGLPIRCLVNRIAGEPEGRSVQSRLADVCRQFLAIPMAQGGWLPDDPRLALQASWQSEAPPYESALLAGIQPLAEALLKEPSGGKKEGQPQETLDHKHGTEGDGRAMEGPEETSQAMLARSPAVVPQAISVRCLFENQAKEIFPTKQSTDDSTSNREQPIYGDTVG